MLLLPVIAILVVLKLMTFGRNVPAKLKVVTLLSYKRLLLPPNPPAPLLYCTEFVIPPGLPPAPAGPVGPVTPVLPWMPV